MRTVGDWLKLPDCKPNWNDTEAIYPCGLTLGGEYYHRDAFYAGRGLQSVHEAHHEEHPKVEWWLLTETLAFEKGSVKRTFSCYHGSEVNSE